MNDEKRPCQALSDLFTTVVKIPAGHGVASIIPMPQLSEAAPQRIREGLARRRITLVDGACPCGAELVLPDADMRRDAALEGRPIRLSVTHAFDCPAGDAAVDEWLEAGGHDVL